MSEFQLIMPKMGESIAEATIIRWLKNEGDTIAADESVLEIATDKVDSEVPTPKGGVLLKKLYNENDVVAVGQAIAIIGIEAGATQTAPPPIAAAPEPAPEPVAVIEKQMEHAAQTVKPVAAAQGNRFYSPLVLNIARSENISMSELDQIAGTGNEGRVTKRDIMAFINGGRKLSAPAATPAAASPEVKVETTQTDTKQASPQVSQPAEQKIPTAKTETSNSKIALMPGDEIIEMDRMRKLIADHMVMSLATSPHVTSFVEADVTNLVMWREKHKTAFEKREGEKITFTPCFIEAVTKAIKDFPMINVSVDGNQIIKRKSINIGMAAALPTGNLIVPVIRNADQLNLFGLTKAVNDLANRARQNKLSPDDIQGGTFTITNVGGFGNLMGTPIINQPQVAILATGSIKKKPAVMETEYGDTIAIRHMMFLSLSYDHRVVDGSLGGTFLRRIADYLEQWDVNREV
ncbi:MAG: dihydrolipoamide acetyltransferase family protein [Bacteroidota bacterium]|nr:dihydrolipoamide acetyltransferase family protein [Bacteroidota bacterium]